MKVIIIEDEPLMADELAREIQNVDPGVAISGKFISVKETINHLAENEMPDLFFSDIQLTDGLSFEIFTELDQPVPVIFCTAFNDYALKAFKANGIDYLLKPFDNSVIKEAIQKYKSLIGSKLSTRDLSNTLAQMYRTDASSKKSLIVHQGQKMFPVKYADIRILFLKNGISYLVTKQGKKHIVNSSLDNMESALNSEFFRVNRQVIIHRDAISHINAFFARKLLVTPLFNIEMDLVVSKAKASNFLNWLEKA